MLTLVDIGDTTHIAERIDATFCGNELTRELRRTVRDRDAVELDAEGAEICYACQIRWAQKLDADVAAAAKYLTKEDGSLSIDNEAKADVLRGLSDADPAVVLGALLGEADHA